MQYRNKLTQAFCLLQIVASFGCVPHLVSLKSAITHYRVLAPEEVIDTPLDLLTHLYASGLLTVFWFNQFNPPTLCPDSFYNVYRWRGGPFSDRSKQLIFLSQSAVIKSVMAMVVKIYPRMKGGASHNSDERSEFLDVQRNFRNWRREGVIWSIIQKLFFSLILFILVQYHLQFLPSSKSISGSW